MSREDGGRHTKWLNFMYPRVVMMRDMLKPTGIIVVSIDDQELYRLGMLMDEIFGEANRLACAPWKSDPGGGEKKSQLRSGHEYLLIYSRGDRNKLTKQEREIVPTHKDKWGKYKKGRELLKWGSHSLREDRETMFLPLIAPDGTEVLPIRNDGKEGRWRWGRQLLEEILREPERAHWEKTRFDPGVTWQGLSERWVPYEKIRDLKRAVGWSTWLDSHGSNPDGTKRLKEIFGDKVFDTVKPVELIEWIISLYEDDEALVLDPFAGSGTTAEAVLRANLKDDGLRRFILIESGTAEDKFSRTLTGERVKRLISGKWAIGKREPLPGGFSFFTTGRRVDKDAILAMEKDELIELICQADCDGSKNSAWIDRIENPRAKNLQYLFGITRQGQGVCLVWDGRSRIDRNIAAKCASEVRQLGLQLPFRVYARSSDLSSPSMQFMQIPDEIIQQLGGQI